MERISHWTAWTAVVLTVAFAGLNWSALMAPTALNLLVAQVEAPLGIVLLGLSAVLVALFLVATLYSRVGTLLEGRRMLKELQQVKDQADKAEASRFAQLQQVVTTEFRALNDRLAKLEQKKPQAESVISLP